MRCLLASILLATGLFAADAAPDQMEQPNSFVAARLNDFVRTQERFKTSPLHTLVASPTGTIGTGQLFLILKEATGRDEAKLLALLTGLRRLGMTFTAENLRSDPLFTLRGQHVAGKDLVQFIAKLSRQTPIEANDSTTLISDGHPAFKLVATKDLLTFTMKRRSDEAIDEKPLVSRTDRFPKADLEVRFDMDLISKLMSDSGREKEMQAVFKKLLVDATLTLGPDGISEDIRLARTGMYSEVKRLTNQPLLEKSKAFASIPADAVWALTWSEGLKELAGIPMVLAEAKIIREREVLDDDVFTVVGSIQAASGPGGIYGQIVDGKLALTARQAAPQALAEIVAMAINRESERMKERSDEANRRSFMRQMLREISYDLANRLVPFLHENAIAAYQDGHLIITTHPKGLSGAIGQGFDKNPAVQAALKRLPDQALMLGLSNGAASWQWVADALRQSVAKSLKVDLLATLPGDVAKANIPAGSFALTLEPDSLRLQSSGLLGGAGLVLGSIALVNVR